MSNSNKVKLSENECLKYDNNEEENNKISEESKSENCLQNENQMCENEKKCIGNEGPHSKNAFNLDKNEDRIILKNPINQNSNSTTTLSQEENFNHIKINNNFDLNSKQSTKDETRNCEINSSNANYLSDRKQTKGGFLKNLRLQIRYGKSCLNDQSNKTSRINEKSSSEKSSSVPLQIVTEQFDECEPSCSKIDKCIKNICANQYPHKKSIQSVLSDKKKCLKEHNNIQSVVANKTNRECMKDDIIKTNNLLIAEQPPLSVNSSKNEKITEGIEKEDLNTKKDNVKPLHSIIEDGRNHFIKVTTPIETTHVSGILTLEKNNSCGKTDEIKISNNEISSGESKEVLATGISAIDKVQMSSITTDFSSIENHKNMSALCDDLISTSSKVEEEDDPYYELEEYLERVRIEINEVFEQYKSRYDGMPLICNNNDSGTSNDKSSKCPSESDNIVTTMPTPSIKAKTVQPSGLNELQTNNEISIKNFNKNNSIKSNPLELRIDVDDQDDTDGVKMWENSIMKELESAMRSSNWSTSKSEKNSSNGSPWSHTNIIKPEKHATIPLQSFNIDCPLKEPLKAYDFTKNETVNNTRRPLSLLKNKFISGDNVSSKEKFFINQKKSRDDVTLLKIEENTIDNELDNTKLEATHIKKETSQDTSLSNNDDIKKGSTSTIWTSEESILKSVSAVDEDNESTSFSTFDETSVLLSSVKSDNSSEMEYNGKRVENIRKEDTELLNNTIENISTSPEDPDLLEVLSQFEDERTNERDEMSIHQNYDDYLEDGVIDHENDVILRNKDLLNYERNHRKNISNMFGRTRKSRSYSIEAVPFSRNEFELFQDMFDKNTKQKHPFCTSLGQESFQNSRSCNIQELPSPSSASLHSGNGTIVMQELTIKSNSAPILLKKEKHRSGFGGNQNTLRYSRSQSDRYLAEIEAIEACKWLRAAGFPQYAQMYEDLQFPIDLNNVAKDHPMLESDPLQSLYRRLCILNRCATMRLDNTYKQRNQQKDESDDEDFTLSENWTFQPQSRRWSRVGETGLEISTKRNQENDVSSKDSSPERSDDHQPDGDPATVRLRRTGSERLKDGAKALLRRVESIKSRRRKRQNREGLVISGPQMLNIPQMNQRMSGMKCVSVTAFSNPPSPTPSSPVNVFPKPPFLSCELKVPTEHDRNYSPSLLPKSPERLSASPRSVHSVRTSPLHFFTATMPHLREGKSDDSSSYYSDSQESTGGGKVISVKKIPSRSRRFLQRSGKVDDIGAHSDSECHSGRKMALKDTSIPEIKTKKLTRGGSLNFGKESKRYRDSFQSRSFRSRTSIRKGRKTSESDKEDGKVKSHVRWHSFRSSESPQLLFKKCLNAKTSGEAQVEGTPFTAMSCGQLQIISKLALVTLTGYMERYCPTHRSGWNWELPKFIKKIKTPDYKDKKVFGVPLLLVLQRTGHSLPAPIRGALKWLHVNGLDQIGLFRKSGVKSRISKLKEKIESSDMDCMDIYDTQQAYDVADMLKQYFRDLPDCLLTTKMSETFIAIFQHLPNDVRADALQSAVLLLPDEHREVLYSLLKFLNEIVDNSKYNQMSANNLAVCLAPSLFYNNMTRSRSTSASPRRRKATGCGVPDMKELSDAKASHECLTFMITNFNQIFTVTRDKVLRCNFGYMEESRPVPLEALGEGMPFHNWRGYLYECTSATIKEGREKSRGWISITSLDQNVEIAYKKVGDGHPLRLWRCITEIEAPPNEVLNYILRERNSWDIDLLKCRTIQQLDDRSEIFQYACDGQVITDYCVLRSWQPDLPRKACVIVETSIDHPDASLLLGGVRGVVLASRYLIEPCGSGKSRLMHLSRVDTKGRSPEWYNKCYGHICSHYLSNIRIAFRQIADGPESKV